MSETAEFIFFQLKPSVKPEDPSNEEGVHLQQVFQTTKQQSGYHSSSWGRTVEDQSVVAWVIGILSLLPLLYLDSRQDILINNQLYSLERPPWREPLQRNLPLYRTRHLHNNHLRNPHTPRLNHRRPNCQPCHRALHPAHSHILDLQRAQNHQPGPHRLPHRAHLRPSRGGPAQVLGHGTCGKAGCDQAFG